MGQAPIEIVEALEINDRGFLRIRDYSLLAAGFSEDTFLRENRTAISTAKAKIFVVDETNVREIELDGARKLIDEPKLIAIARKTKTVSPRRNLQRLWKDLGPPTLIAKRY